jgi:hypothetical protein
MVGGLVDVWITQWVDHWNGDEMDLRLIQIHYDLQCID